MGEWGGGVTFHERMFVGDGAVMDGWMLEPPERAGQRGAE